MKIVPPSPTETIGGGNLTQALLQLLGENPENPETTKLRKLNSLNKEEVYFLILHGTLEDWLFYANFETEFGNERTEALLQAIYAWINNGAYEPDEGELDQDQKTIYKFLQSRLRNKSSGEIVGNVQTQVGGISPQKNT